MFAQSQLMETLDAMAKVWWSRFAIIPLFTEFCSIVSIIVQAKSKNA